MGEQVVLQIGLFGETFRALTAAVRPGALMNVRVATQIARRGERLIAVRTLVRLFLKGAAFDGRTDDRARLTFVCVMRW